MIRASAWALMALCICFACDDEDDGGTGGAGAAMAGGAGGSAGGAGGSATPDVGLPDAALPDAMAPAPDLGPPPESCEAGGYTECFSNYDCEAADRCLALDGDGFVVCCVPGERGDLQAGEDCSMVEGQRACASSLCFETNQGSWCSDQCQGPGDCPAMFPRCEPIAFAGDGNWCQPALE
ncbi:MAG: hypothetical protein ACE366_15265 [Bradymonadia bacterium]